VTKQKISADGTYVFDAEEIEQLDELSLTSVLSAIVDPVPQEDSEPKSTLVAAVPGKADTTINEILKGQGSAQDQRPTHRGLNNNPLPAETSDDLIDPALVFPELTPRPR